MYVFTLKICILCSYLDLQIKISAISRFTGICLMRGTRPLSIWVSAGQAVMKQATTQATSFIFNLSHFLAISNFYLYISN